MPNALYRGYESNDLCVSRSRDMGACYETPYLKKNMPTKLRKKVAVPLDTKYLGVLLLQ